MACLIAGNHPADCYRSGYYAPAIFAPSQAVPAMVVKSRKRLLREAPDRAILRLAGALARQAAREVHAREWPPTGRTGTPAAARKSSTPQAIHAMPSFAIACWIRIPTSHKNPSLLQALAQKIRTVLDS